MRGPTYALLLGALTLGCTGDDAAADDGGPTTQATGSSGGADDTTGAGGSDSGTVGDVDSTSGAESPGETDSSSGSSGADTGIAACSATLFANFDGPTLSAGQEDATNDMTAIAELAMDLPPYDGPLDLDEVLAIVEGHFAPFNVCVTRERPATGPYTMIVVTPSNPFGVGVKGISSLDCGDTNPNNVGFVFPDGTWDVSARALANGVSSEFSPALGLESQSTDEADLLCRSDCAVVPDLDRSFRDTCIPIAQPVGRPCATQHEAHCTQGEQNSFQEMLATYGPAR